MKKMLLSAVCLSMLVLGSAQAGVDKPQDGMMPPPSHEMAMKKGHNKMSQKLGEELSLTEEQKAMADKIREEGRKKMEPLMQEKKALHEKMDAVRRSNMEEFENILTPEQKQKFSEIKAKHKDHKKFGHRHHPGHDKAPKAETKQTSSEKKGN